MERKKRDPETEDIGEKIPEIHDPQGIPSPEKDPETNQSPVEAPTDPDIEKQKEIRVE